MAASTRNRHAETADCAAPPYLRLGRPSAPSAVIPFKASGFKVRESCVSPMLVGCQCTNGTTDFTAAVAFEHRAACDSSCLKPVANLAVHVRRPGRVAF